MPRNDQFPPDMDPLPSDHDFYTELAQLVEEHESEDLDRERLLFAAKQFGEEWVETLYMTGETW